MSPPPLHGQRPELPEDSPDDQDIPLPGRSEDDYQYLYRLVQKLSQVQKLIAENVRYLVKVVDWAFDDDRNTSPISKLNKLYDTHRMMMQGDATNPDEMARIPKQQTQQVGPKPWWGGLITKETILAVLVMLSVLSLVFVVLVLSYSKLTVTSDGVSGEQSRVVGPAVPGHITKQEPKP